MMLREAKEHCDYLIAALQTDPTIDRPSKNKPVQSIVERMIQLEACRYVDEIVVYATEQDLRDILLAYPINVRILGDEYKGTEFTGHDLPIENYFNTRKHSFSTTELRTRIHRIQREKMNTIQEDFGGIPDGKAKGSHVMELPYVSSGQKSTSSVSDETSFDRMHKALLNDTYETSVA